jgi:type II secretory ATPase GspE/PulE/Tfp pilus assembly ATPase PilB-like protein
MGAEPYLVASSLIGVVAQRLVRINCPRCKQPVEEKPVELGEIGITQEDLKTHTILAGQGCPECRGVGFRGRSGVYEMLSVDDEIRQMIVKREAASVIKQYAMRTQNMITLLKDGRRRVLEGDTTIKEVLRVCQREGFE